MRFIVRAITSVVIVVWASGAAAGQGLGGAGTVQGVVKDPSGAVMASVQIELANPVSGFKRTTTTDATGRFSFTNLPPNPYHVAATTGGFAPFEGDVDVRTAVPIEFNIAMKLATTTETVQVQAHAEDLLEVDPTAHTDVDQSLISRMVVSAGSGLNQVVTLASPGVVADSNGFFHPVGDHAQTQFSIDNQPVTDQQSKLYSNQISQDAVESMEVITGVPPAEYGDKSSLIVHIVTRSGLDQPKPTGTLTFGYGSFKSPSADLTLGAGTKTFGNFLSVSGTRTERFLDPPEFDALHDTGDNQSFFDRFDARPSPTSTFHLNVQAARSAFDIPNTFDQQDSGQAQQQKIVTFNVAPGYVHVIGTKTVLTANAFVRRDHVTYTPSADLFSDTPGTVSQDRTLTNVGGKVDLEYASGVHDVKIGGTVSATKLKEQFTIGFTDPTVNTPCVDAEGTPSEDSSLTTIDQCSAAGLDVNPDFSSDLVAYDLTRGGGLFAFNAAATIKEQSAYLQDNIRAGHATFKVGVRVDHYDGVVTDSLVQPRLGVSYLVPQSGTVLRASYGRTLETPYNENLLLSGGYGASGALVGEGNPLPPGHRNEGEIGIQQGVGRWLVADFGYFNKHTDNAYDFNVLFDTPIVFPVAWVRSRIDGFTGRIDFVEHAGFRASVVMAHTNSIFSPPGTGGVLLEQATADFRIDHDQKFNSTANFQYTFPTPLGAWAALSWRYDSGLVAGEVPDYATALGLSPDEQAAIGVFCGDTVATRDAPITDCASSSFGAKRLVIPGTPDNPDPADDVANPPRIAPRHLFDLGIGLDNLLHTDKAKVRLRFNIVNLTNKEALYNFLSTFSGTHFVTPRAYQVQIGVCTDGSRDLHPGGCVGVPGRTRRPDSLQSRSSHRFARAPAPLPALGRGRLRAGRARRTVRMRCSSGSRPSSPSRSPRLQTRRRFRWSRPRAHSSRENWSF